MLQLLLDLRVSPVTVTVPNCYLHVFTVKLCPHTNFASYNDIINSGSLVVFRFILVLVS